VNTICYFNRLTVEDLGMALNLRGRNNTKKKNNVLSYVYTYKSYVFSYVSYDYLGQIGMIIRFLA
jgi:hypothetical protein